MNTIKKKMKKLLVPLMLLAAVLVSICEYSVGKLLPTAKDRIMPICGAKSLDTDQPT